MWLWLPDRQRGQCLFRSSLRSSRKSRRCNLPLPYCLRLPNRRRTRSRRPNLCKPRSGLQSYRYLHRKRRFRWLHVLRRRQTRCIPDGCTAMFRNCRHRHCRHIRRRLSLNFLYRLRHWYALFRRYECRPMLRVPLFRWS